MKRTNGRRRHRGHNRKNYSNINKNTVLESSGPKSQVRGNDYQLNEKYSSLANDAVANDDKILSECYFQYADHYYRLNKEIEAAMLLKMTDNNENKSDNNENKIDNTNENNNIQKDTINSVEKNKLSRKDRSLLAKSEESSELEIEEKLPKKFTENKAVNLSEVNK